VSLTCTFLSLFNRNNLYTNELVPKTIWQKTKRKPRPGITKNQRRIFYQKITKAIAGKSTIDEEVLDQLEDALISADVGVDTTVQIIERIQKSCQRKNT